MAKVVAYAKALIISDETNVKYIIFSVFKRIAPLVRMAPIEVMTMDGSPIIAR